MSRNTGTFNFAANFEGLLKAPIDARQLVETLADLTGATTWNASGNIWLYDGAIVSVSNDLDPQNNGIYFLKDADNYNNIDNWVKVGEGTGTITGGTNGLSTDGANIVLGGTLLSGTTITIATGTTLTIEDLRTTTVGLQYAGDYEMDFTPRSLVTKLYVDSVATGLDPKLAVEVATTSTDGNIDLTGGTFTGGSTIDGIVVQDGWRVLIKNQTSGEFNGIWVYSGSSDTFYRSDDFDEDSEVIQGALIPVISGSTNKNTLWVLVTPNPITLDTTPLEFSLFSSPIITAGHGIDISGVTISVDGSVLAGNGIIWSGDTFNVDTSIIDYPITGATNGLTVIGKDVTLGGTLNGNTTIDAGTNSLTITGNSNQLKLYGFDAQLIGDRGRIVTNYGGGGNTTLFENNALGLLLQNVGTETASLCISTNGTIFTNTCVDTTGIEYAADYSANFVNRSLVDKEYVDTEIIDAITGATLTYENGLTQTGQIVSLGGTLTGDTTINTLTHDIIIGEQITGGSFYIISDITTDFVIGMRHGSSSYINVRDTRIDLQNSGNACVFLTNQNVGLSVCGSNTCVDLYNNSMNICVANAEIHASNNCLSFNPNSANGRFTLNPNPTIGDIFLGSDTFGGQVLCMTYVNTSLCNSGSRILIDNQSCICLITSGGSGVLLTSGSASISDGVAQLVISSSCLILTGGNVYIDTPPTGTTSDALLVWNSIDKIVKQIDGAAVLTSAITGATNGLTKVGQDVVLGGDLTENTTIDLSTFDLKFSGDSLQYSADYSAGYNARSIPDVDFLTGYTQSAVTQSSNVLNVTDFTGTGYTATTTSDFIGASGGSTIFLPDSPKDGQRIVVADIGGDALSSSIHICSMIPSQHIIGGTEATINTDYGSITFIFNSKCFWSAAAFIN